MGSNFTLNWVCLVWQLLGLKRGPKTLRRVPKPSTGSRRRGPECPKLLFSIFEFITCLLHDKYQITNILFYMNKIPFLRSVFLRSVFLRLLTFFPIFSLLFSSASSSPSFILLSPLLVFISKIFCVMTSIFAA